MKKLLLLLLFSSFAQAQLTIETPPDYIICDNYGTGYATFDLTVMDMPILAGSELNPSQYQVTYFETQADAQSGTNPIVNAYAYSSTTSPQTIYARVSGTSGEYGITQFSIITNITPILPALPPLVIFEEEPYDGLATVTLTGYTEGPLENLNIEGATISFYTTQQDAMNSANPIADPASYVVQNESTVYFRLENIGTGCYSVSNFDVIVLPDNYQTPPPTAATGITFTQGDTLADIELNGENIQWYSNDGTVTGPPDEPGDTLPLTTVLVEGTTYYASQTVYGIESNERLPVTVNFSLGLYDVAFAGLQYYPNPVKDILTIKNTNEIESVSIHNNLGQVIDSLIINGNDVNADLSQLSAGIYFIKIASGSQQKTLKIIKE